MYIYILHLSNIMFKNNDSDDNNHDNDNDNDNINYNSNNMSITYIYIYIYLFIYLSNIYIYMRVQAFTCSEPIKKRPSLGGIITHFLKTWEVFFGHGTWPAL